MNIILTQVILISIGLLNIKTHEYSYYWFEVWKLPNFRSWTRRRFSCRDQLSTIMEWLFLMSKKEKFHDFLLFFKPS